MKTLFCIIISLFLLGSMFSGCSDQIVNSNETSSSEGSVLSKKPKKPPQTPSTPLPALNLNNQFIAGISDGKVYIWDGSSLTENITRIWSTSIEAFTINGLGIGDFIDDGNKQLLVARRIKVGKGKKNRVETEELLIFKEEDTEPFKTVTLRLHEDYTDALWAMKIADVDDDNDLEIILVFRDQIEIWEFDGEEFSISASLNYFSKSEIPFGVDIGDYDDVVGNEIIVAFTGNIWRVYKFDGNNLSYITDGIPYDEIGSLNCAKIADIDDDGDIEIVGAGSTGKILIWESPEIIIASEAVIPGYYFSAVDIGEIDGNSLNGKEIIGGSYYGGLHLFHYDGINNKIVYGYEIIPGLNISLNGVIVSDVEDKIIVATSNGLEVFDNTYSPVFVDNLGSLDYLIFE